MPDEQTDNVYGTISGLCESLLHDFAPNRPTNETSVRKLKAKAYEILLKKSRQHVVLEERDVDPIRELDIKQFEFRLESKRNPERMLKCLAFGNCLDFVEQESYFKTDSARGILIFLLALAESNRRQEDVTNSQAGDLLIPGPFTLHATQQDISYYPPPSHTDTILPTTFKTLQLLKDHRNLLDEPPLEFYDDPSKRPPRKTNSAFSLYSPTNSSRRPTSAKSAKSQETWRCGLSIDPSSCRFFNLTSDLSSTTSKEEVKCKTVNVFNTDSSNLDVISSQPTIRQTFSWNWEALGQLIPCEPPFASETNSILHLHASRAYAYRGSFEAKIVQSAKFLIDLKNVTIGIQSDSFCCNESMIFSMEPNITIDTISPAVMEKFVRPFVECGSCYKRLQVVIAKKNIPFMFDGFIFKATCGAIEEYLIKFRQFVVLHRDHTLLQFYKRMKKMMNQLTYLAHVFAIHPEVDPDIRPPMGSQFLGYIYKEITSVTQKDITMLLVYILKQCCYAYFKYLQKWIFYGILEDPRNELFICFVDHYRVNTKYHFDKAYFVRKESVPGFLQGFEDQILQCGKYTMLLKAYNPTHPIFEFDYPSISVCLSFDEIKKMETKCREYINRAERLCGPPVSASDIFRELKAARQKFQAMVLEKSRKTFEKWAVDSENQAAEETARKRKRLEELQTHLQQVQDRRLADKKNELALDLKILKEAQEIDDKRVAQENAEIQKRIEYYQQLNAIIEERKQRAEMVASTTNVRIETDPGTPISSTTEFESCLGDEEDDDSKSVYEDATITTEFTERFLETEKKLNEIFASTNNNHPPQPSEIRRSVSDVLNSNDALVSESKQNKLKVLGSSIGSYLVEDSSRSSGPQCDGSKALLTEAQKIKLKVLSSEFGIDLNRNKAGEETATAVVTSSKTATVLSDLEVNRRRMMQNDPFAKLNEVPERRKLQLDLNTERSRNRRRVLESEYNILTGSSNFQLTPMSTTSESPITDEYEDDLKNANVLKLIVPPRRSDSKWSIKTPDMDLLTGTTVEETPECGLNTAGIMVRKGFDFNRPQTKSDSLIIMDSNESTTTTTTTYTDCIELSSDEKSEQFQPEFKWKLVSELLSMNRDGNGSCDANISEEKKATELNVITLTEFLQKSVAVPLSAHLIVMNREIMRLYLRELNILGHFKSLRNYFFLMDGEFGSIVCDGLIGKLENGAQPNELLSYRMLHTILDNALGSSIIGNDQNSDNVSFIVSEKPEKFDLQSTECLSSLSLSYRVLWPVNLILNPETLEKYSIIFKYLIKVRRISWVLEEVYQQLKGAVKKNGKDLLLSPQYRTVQKIRHKFLHFVHALNNHITSSALQASWKTFKDDLLSAKSIEDIYRKHTNYIKRILFLCMLNKKSAEFYNAIECIFKVTLRFSRNLKSREWELKPNEPFYTHSRYERLLADEIEFEKFIKFVIYLGNKIVRHGYQEEIGEFINLINFNHYYAVE